MSEAVKFVANRWRTRRSPFPYCHAIIAETDASLERTLPELKPAFLEQYRGGHCQVDEKLVDRPPRYWASARREPAMLGIKSGR